MKKVFMRSVIELFAEFKIDFFSEVRYNTESINEKGVFVMAVIKKAKITVLLMLLILFGFTKNLYAADMGKATKNAKLKKTVEESSITLEIIPKGDEFEILEEEENWYRVNYKKIKGYVKKELVEVTKEETSDQGENDTKEQSQNTKENDNKEQETTNTMEGTTSQEPETNTALDTQGTTTVSAPVVSTGEIQEGSKGIVTSGAKLFVRPLLNSIKIEDITQNQPAEIINVANQWVYLLVNGKTGWVRKEFVAVTKQEEPVTTQEPEKQEVPEENEEEKEAPKTETVNKTAYVSSDGLNIRKEASTESEIVDVLGKNAQVTIIEEDGTWCKITYKNTEGYAPKKYLSDEKVAVTSRSSVERGVEVTNIQEPKAEQKQEETKKETEGATSSDKASKLVAFAKQYLGSRYVYGGSSPSGFDCSGFVMYVYKQFGVSLPHSSSAQSKKGTKVEKANLQPADIVFFSDYKTHKGIGHCGIYIGNNQFIHASTEKTGVITSSLNSGSYKTRYVTAVRIF